MSRTYHRAAKELVGKPPRSSRLRSKFHKTPSAVLWEKARRLAANIAKLPKLVRIPKNEALPEAASALSI